jgi:hypothetical protein
MPFKSEKQRRYMHANLPEIAKRWERDYAGGGIARVGYQQGMTVAPYPNPILTNMQRMKPLALDVMTGQHQPGISPHFGGYGPIDPYGNIQMGLEKENFYQSPQGLAFLRNKMGNMFSGATNTMGNMFTGAKDFASGIFSGAKNQGGALVGNIMGALSGIPGLGMLLGSIRPDNPYEKFQEQMFLDPEVNFMGGVGGPNKDPFGKNVRSLFGEYDVREQFDKLAKSKIGQDYGYEDAMEDGVLTEEELRAMKAEGLRGWQLNRFKTLFEAKKRADQYQKGIANRAKEERMAKERERQAQMARSNRVVLDRPQGPRGDGGGSWHAQTAAKEKAFADTGGKQGKVAGPGFGKGAYFNQGGLASLWQK